MAKKEISSTPATVDLGKHKHKRVIQLQEGRGRLVDRIAEAVDEMKAAGRIEGNVQPVVVIVERRSKSARIRRALSRPLRWG